MARIADDSPKCQAGNDSPSVPLGEHSQRLGNASVRSRVEAWLAAYAPDLFLSQEPFQLMMSDRPNLAGFRLLATNPLTSRWIAEQHANPTVV